MPKTDLIGMVNRWVLVKVETIYQPYGALLEKILYDMADLKRIWLFSGWFQVMSVVSWLVPDSSWVASSGYRWFRSFHVVPRFNKYIGVFMKKV